MTFCFSGTDKAVHGWLTWLQAVCSCCPPSIGVSFPPASKSHLPIVVVLCTPMLYFYFFFKYAERVGPTITKTLHLCLANINGQKSVEKNIKCCSDTQKTKFNIIQYAIESFLENKIWNFIERTIAKSNLKCNIGEWKHMLPVVSVMASLVVRSYSNVPIFMW